MNDVKADEPDGTEEETDLVDLFREGQYEDLLLAVDAEWDTTDPKDLIGRAAMAAKAAAQLGRNDSGIAWLARVETREPTRFDHLILADANVSLGRTDEARRHRLAASTATFPDDDADTSNGLEIVVAARLGEDLARLDQLSPEDFASADGRHWAPDLFAADWLFQDKDWAASLIVGEWAAAAGRPWATEPFLWQNVATAAAPARPDLAVRALEGRTDTWQPALAQEADILLADALMELGERARAVEAATRAAALKGPLQRRAACSARLYSCNPADLRCQFEAWKAWWMLVQADSEPDRDERAAVGANLLRVGTNNTDLGKLALELVGPVASADPLAPAAELTRAFVALGEQHYEEALSHLNSSDLPDDIAAQHGVLIGRASALLNLDRLDEALTASAKARELREEFGAATGTSQPILSLDLLILERSAHWRELADASRAAMSSDMSHDQQVAAQSLLIAALIELGDLEGAVDHGHSMVEEQDEADADLATRIGVANVCQMRGKLDNALALLGEDVPEASDRLRLRRWILCLQIADRRSDVDAAIKALRGAAALDGDFAKLLDYYLAILRPEDPDAPSLESLTNPGDEPTLMSLLIAANARTVLQQGGVDELLASAVALEPSAADAAMYRIPAAAVAASLGDEAGVRRLLGDQGERILALTLAVAARNAQDRDAPEGRRRQLDYLDQAIAAARPDVEVDRLTLVSVGVQKAAVLLNAGDAQAAKEAVAEAKTMCRADDTPLIRFLPGFFGAIIAMSEEAWHEIVAQIRALELADMPKPVAAIAHQLGGIAHWRLGELEAARTELCKSVGLKSDGPSFLLLGRVELGLEDPEGARDALVRAIQEGGVARAEVHTLLSHAERLLHHDTTAIERAREAIGFDHQDASAQLALGAALAAAGRWEPALSAFDQGLRLKPPTGIRQQLWLNRLVVLARLDRYEQIVKAAAAPPQLNEASLALLAECHAGALDGLGRRSEAMVVLRGATTNTHLSSTMRRAVAQADDIQIRQGSWLGFWFGPGTSNGRRAIGAALIIVGATIAILLAINPERAGWLSWRSPGAEAAIPLVIVAVLFLIPLATSLKVAGVEIVVPAAPEPTLVRIEPAAISGVLETTFLRDLIGRAQELSAAATTQAQGLSVATAQAVDSAAAAALPSIPRTSPTQISDTMGVGRPVMAPTPAPPAANHTVGTS